MAHSAQRHASERDQILPAGNRRHLLWILSGRTAVSSRLPLIALAAAAILPILVFSAVMVVLFDQQQQAVLERNLRQAARSAVLDVERRIVADASMLRALAASPDVDKGDFEKLRDHMGRVIQRRPDWLSVQLIDQSTMEPVVSAAARSSLTPRLDTDLIRRTAESRLVEVSDLHSKHGEIPYHFAIALPVPRDGQFRYVMTAEIDAGSLGRVLAAETIDDDWGLGLLDRNRTLVAHSRADMDQIGKPAPPSLITELERAETEYFFTVDRGGQRLYGSYATSGWLDWVVAVGVPASVVEWPLRRTLFVVIGAGSGALATALLLATILIRAVSRRHDAERQLLALEAQQTIERRLADIAANLPGVVYRRVVHPDGTISHPYVSSGLERLLDISSDEVKQGLSLEEFAETYLAPDAREAWVRALSEASTSGNAYSYEAALLSRSGEVRWVHSMARSRRNADGSVIWDGVLLDITERKQVEQRLAASLAEKETLLREIHHRVRNNLQVVSSLLQLEIRALPDPHARERLNRVSQRIAVLGRVHDQLYSSENFARIDFAEHLHQICSNLRQIYQETREFDVDLTVDADRLYCEIDTAIPLGLMVNELVTNALKHGVSSTSGPGRIRIELKRSPDGDKVTLLVEDNGHPPPSEQDPSNASGLGMRIIRALAAQIEAELDIRRDSGWRVTVVVPGHRLTP